VQFFFAVGFLLKKVGVVSRIPEQLLPVEFEEGEIGPKMTAEGRAASTRDLLVWMMREVTRTSSTVIVLEDAHWLDSASWALSEAVLNELHPLLLVIVTRPLPAAEMPAELARLLARESTVAIKLDALSAEDTLALVCERLDVDSIPEQVGGLIRAKAEGHPFFAEQFAYALRDRGAIRIEQGECRIIGDPAQLDAVGFPDTVQGMVSSRIDRLTPQQQLTLKVASIVGPTFDAHTLRQVHPIAAEGADFDGQLREMAGLDFLKPEGGAPAGVYGFKHAITQEVAYRSIPISQRQRLHAAVAEWLESQEASVR